MKKSVLLFSLLSGTALVLPDLTVASGIFSTHTNSLKPEPTFSFIDMSHSYKTAAICFLGHGDCDPNMGFGKGDDYEIKTDNRCTNEGFYKNNCNEVQVPTGYCPYNSSYINGCKCDPSLITCPAGQVGVGTACGGKYKSCKCDPNLIACPSNKNGTGASCGGKYQSCTCKSEYVYTSSNCTSPRSVSGSSCDGKYTGCVCPTGVSPGTYGCKTYYGSPCSSVCKEAYTDNCHNRTAKTCTYGCKSNYSDCSSKCETCYTDNCRNTTPVSCPQGCASNYSDCSTECAKCKVISCNTPKANVDNFLTSSEYTTIGGQSIYNYGTPKGIGCFRGKATTASAMLGLHGWNCSSCTAQSEDGTQTSGYNCTCVAKTTYPNASKTTGANGSARDTMCGGVVIVCPNAGCKSGYTYSGGGCVEGTCGSEYSLSSCPSNGTCSNCKSGSTTKYKLDSCNSGYSKSGDSCVKNASCSSGGYRNYGGSGIEKCDTVSYEGLTCYTNCRMTVNIYEDFSYMDINQTYGSSTVSCGMGPFVTGTYGTARSNSKYFDRSSCSGNKSVTTKEVPTGNTVWIDVYSSSYLKMCQIYRGMPGSSGSVDVCERDGNGWKCQTVITNASTGTGYHDYYIVYAYPTQNYATINNVQVTCR